MANSINLVYQAAGIRAARLMIARNLTVVARTLCSFAASIPGSRRSRQLPCPAESCLTR